MQYKKTISAIGGSQGIILPLDLLKYLELKVGDEILIQDDEGKHGKFISMWKAE